MKEEERNNIFSMWNNKAIERSSFYYNMLSLTIKLENIYLVESLKILIKSQITISTHLRKRQTFIIIKTRCVIIIENLYFCDVSFTFQTFTYYCDQIRSISVFILFTFTLICNCRYNFHHNCIIFLHKRYDL